MSVPGKKPPGKKPPVILSPRKMLPENCPLGKSLIDIKHLFTVVNNKLVKHQRFVHCKSAIFKCGKNKILILKKKAN